MKTKLTVLSTLSCLFLAAYAAGCFQETQAEPGQRPGQQTPSDASEDGQSPKRNDQQSAKPSEQKQGQQVKAKTAETNRGWPLFRGDARATGVARSTLPEKLEVLWEFEVEKGAFGGTPTIVANKQEKVVYIGDLDGKIFALDLATGKKKWEFQSEIGFVTAPAVRDGRVYIGDIDGVFYCLDSQGKEKWRFQAGASIDSSANFYKDYVIFGSQDARLYALNVKTGKPVWIHEAQDQIRCSTPVGDNRGFVAGCDGFLHIIDLDNGKEAGSVEIESPTGVTPAVLGSMLYVGTEQGGFFGIDWKAERTRWKFEDPDGAASIRGCPAVNRHHVVYGARNRKVYSLNPRTGKPNWTRTLKSGIESSPVIIDQRVFVASTDGRLYTMQLDTGKILWERQFNGGFIGSPAVAFDRLVIATDHGVVYCLGKK